MRPFIVFASLLYCISGFAEMADCNIDQQAIDAKTNSWVREITTPNAGEICLMDLTSPAYKTTACKPLLLTELICTYVDYASNSTNVITFCIGGIWQDHGANRVWTCVPLRKDYSTATLHYPG